MQIAAALFFFVGFCGIDQVLQLAGGPLEFVHPTKKTGDLDDRTARRHVGHLQNVQIGKLRHAGSVYLSSR